MSGIITVGVLMVAAMAGVICIVLGVFALCLSVLDRAEKQDPL